MGDVRRRAYIRSLAEEKDNMDPQRFAYISDDTYTAAEVEEFTEVGWLGGRPRDSHEGWLPTAR